MRRYDLGKPALSSSITAKPRKQERRKIGTYRLIFGKISPEIRTNTDFKFLWDGALYSVGHEIF